MENFKSGKQILEDFFNEIENLPEVDKEIAELFTSLYSQNKFTDTNIKNELQKLREAKDENKD
ncbi:MAG: hypothetical protein GX660_15430 [Clostridiaceae bacterium]|jgi:hypothetical protein|nr:hypothetical protein [Bacteroidales bacterium]NLD48555.1 hypothetical protein [Clostridiaceae bacterium]